jgi:hypothetical protein
VVTGVSLWNALEVLPLTIATTADLSGRPYAAAAGWAGLAVAVAGLALETVRRRLPDEPALARRPLAPSLSAERQKREARTRQVSE